MGVIIIIDPTKVALTSNFCHYAAGRELISTDRWERWKRAVLRRDEQQEAASGGKPTTLRIIVIVYKISYVRKKKKKKEKKTS